MSSASSSLRQFNRNFTQRIGVLDDRFLGLSRPLGASRLLWEIGHRAQSVADLRVLLDLDSAYLSRLLRQLEAESLIETQVDPNDRRRRIVHLTKDGQAEWNELDERSDNLAEALLEPLSPEHQQRLVDALETADRLIRAATVTVNTSDPEDPATILALRAYFTELNDRFDSGFDPGNTVTADAASYRPPNGYFMLGRSGEETVGCGAVHVLGPGVAEIKRMWIDKRWRGFGLGRKMLSALENQARELGCQTVRLDTNSTLVEAIAMYSSSGYEPIERYNDNPFAKCWFEKALDAHVGSNLGAS